jgi:rhodanese-related sulfurtransferase
MESVNAITLKNMIGLNEDFMLVDVREPHEHEAGNIGGHLIPMGDLVENLGLFPAGKKIVFYCQKGIRSVIAIQRLQAKLPDNHLVNLSGGIEAWIKVFGATGI